MRGQRVAGAGRGYNSTTGCRPRSSRIRSRAMDSSPPVASARSKAMVVAGGRRERPGGGGGASGVAVWALVACNVASLAFLVRGFVDGVAVRSSVATTADGVQLPEDEAEPEHAAALAPDAVLSLELGDPTMYEAFWRQVGQRAATVIPGWQAMSYSSAGGRSAHHALGPLPLGRRRRRRVRRRRRRVHRARLLAEQPGRRRPGELRRRRVQAHPRPGLLLAAVHAHHGARRPRHHALHPVQGHRPRRHQARVGAGEGPRGRPEDGLLRRPEQHRRVQGLAAARRQHPRRGRRRLRRRRRGARRRATPLRLRAAAHGGAVASPARRRGRVRRVQPAGGDIRLLHLHQADRDGLPCVRVAAMREGRRRGLRRVPRRAQDRGARRRAVRRRPAVRQGQHA